MKTSFIIGLTLVAMLFFLACKPSKLSGKNGSPQKPDEVNGKTGTYDTEVRYCATLGGPFFRPICVSEISSSMSDGKAHYRLHTKNGKVTKTEYIYPNGRIEEANIFISGPDSGSKIYTVNANGVTSETSIFDPDNENYEIFARNGSRELSGCHHKKVSFYERDNEYIYACLNKQNRIMADSEGVATEHQRFNDMGLLAEIKYFDVVGQPTNSSDGYNRVTYEYNDKGLEVRRIYFDLNDKPIVNKSVGCAGRDTEYYNNNLKSSSTCLDSGLRPCSDHNGAIRYIYEYNQNGCILSTRYVDSNDSPMAIISGIAEISNIPGSKCETAEMSFWGTGHKAVKSPSYNAHKVTFKYDGQGQKLSEIFLDEKGAPAKGGSCMAYEYRYEYDELGNCVKEAYYDSNENLVFCLSSQGTWKINTLEYNKRGQLVKSQQWITNNVLRKKGWHTQEYAYDANECRIELHEMGKPEFFIISRRDNDCRLFEVKYLDAKREPANISVDFIDVDDPRGSYHRVELVYDEKGNHLQDIYYKKDGKKIATVDCSVKKCF